VSDEQGLLAAIIDAPDDDAPRLVYADWCLDQSRPERARFIRLQCQSARGATPELLAEEAALLAAHRAAWVAELPRWPGLSWSDGDDEPGGLTQFTRGFVSELTAENWQALSRHGAKAFAAAPVTRLRVKKLPSSSYAKFAGWPPLSRVEELVLEASGICYALVFVLGRSTHLTRLRVLNLAGNGLADQGGIDLRHAGWLGGLRELELEGNQFGRGTCQVLASLGAEGKLAKLEALHLTSNPLYDSDVWPFFDGPWLPQRLRLNFMRLTSRTAERIAACPASRRLRKLILGWNGIDDRGAEALAESPHLADLCELDLRSNEMTDRGREALRRRFAAAPERPFSLLLDGPAPGDSTTQPPV
jgi:uncharacterized protein (TIGR02996 family)